MFTYDHVTTVIKWAAIACLTGFLGIMAYGVGEQIHHDRQVWHEYPQPRQVHEDVQFPYAPSIAQTYIYVPSQPTYTYSPPVSGTYFGYGDSMGTGGSWSFSNGASATCNIWAPTTGGLAGVSTTSCRSSSGRY
jgi:hypothetical protein